MSLNSSYIENNKRYNIIECDDCLAVFKRRADNKNTSLCKSCTCKSVSSRRLLKKLSNTISGLKVIRDLGMNKATKPKREAIFLCECGNEFKATINAVKTGKKLSCGCRRGKSNESHKLSKHPLYRKWAGMITRTTNKKDTHYHSYGGRGVKVCDEWRYDFKSFYDWAYENGYRNGLTIDRIDNDGNYEHRNCQWVTMHENSIKDRHSTFLIRNKQQEICELYKNEHITVTEISIRYKTYKKHISDILKLNNIKIEHRRMKKC